MWNVILTTRFENWFDEQELSVRKKILADLLALETYGPNLGRPTVDSVYGSRHSNMKELRIQCQGKPFRAFFAFDPLRRAVVLCAGKKSGNEKRFYKEMISIADSEFSQYLAELEKR
ncbi:type II toxin-antitoxin system RelE/ParE family toxin [Salmonella enterica]|nr:type II toxin-antitoxin system RelE/ParE family toxin [Salmonella enterica]